MERLIIFHYHLRRGGVTTVIEQQINILRKYYPRPLQIIVATGETPADGVISHTDVTSDTQTMTLETIPQLAYFTEDRDDFEAVRQQLREILPQRYGGALWWVHNYHLGKNTAFTAALLDILAENRQQQAILQIHDFPESGRWANMRMLRRYLHRPLYPLTDNIRYALINRRDYKIMRQIVPENQLFLINNPLPAVSPIDSADKNSQITLIKKRFHGRFLIENAPFFIYPVRAIRRKNLLEAALIAKLAPDNGANLIITLPGVSQSESGYSKMVEQLYAERTIAGLFGIGAERGIDLAQLASLSDLVISTSTQEGFGYLFFQTRQWRKRLLARRLPVLDGFDDLFSTDDCFYRQLMVEIDRDTRDKLKEKYYKLINQHFNNETAEWLANAIETKLDDRGLSEFSYLSIETQRRVLQKCADNNYLNLIRSRNRLLTEFLALITDSSSDRQLQSQKRLNDLLGSNACYQSIAAMLSSFEQKLYTDDVNHVRYGDQRRIESSFVGVENIRLLYQPY